VDRRVFIMGFGLYGSSNGSSDYVAQIELKQSFGAVLASGSSKYVSDGSSRTFRVFFETPVQVIYLYIEVFLWLSDILFVPRPWLTGGAHYVELTTLLSRVMFSYFKSSYDLGTCS
jgi:hypothetical protein